MPVGPTATSHSRWSQATRQSAWRWPTERVSTICNRAWGVFQLPSMREWRNHRPAPKTPAIIRANIPSMRTEATATESPAAPVTGAAEAEWAALPAISSKSGRIWRRWLHPKPLIQGPFMARTSPEAGGMPARKKAHFRAFSTEGGKELPPYPPFKGGKKLSRLGRRRRSASDDLGQFESEPVLDHHNLAAGDQF